MSEKLEEIQDLILARLHAGEAVSREAEIDAHPEHAADLKAFFDLLDVIEDRPGAGVPAPTRLGEFRIVRELGRGGMGVVYEAEQPSLRRRVALKVLPPALCNDARLVSRFRREAEAAGRLRHSGIVPVFSVGEVAGAPFFAMELVDGETLESIIRRRRGGDAAGLPEAGEAWRRWAVETVAQVAEALAYAHGQGILHRDVKPGNIIVEKESCAPRLTDFGLALDLHAPGLTLAGEVFGSPQYMSPEQAVRQEAPVDERTDVYSLAVTLYELLTLRLPYDGTTSAELLTALAQGQVIPPRRADPDLPRALEAVLMRALRRDPRERYAGPAAFADDLHAVLEGRPTRVPRRRWRLGLGCLGFLVLSVAVAFLLWPVEPEKPGARLIDTLELDADLATRLMFGATERDVAFWLDVERALGRGLDLGFLPDDVMPERRRARRVAREFCLEWSEWSDADTRPKLAKLEQDLKAAGAAAAPYLFDVLGANQYDAFGKTDPKDGITARMQVRALFAVGMLELEDAIPFLILHCRGHSLTATSTAATVLQKLAGADFDASWLKDVDVVTVDWWAKQRAKSEVGMNALVERMIRDLRTRVAADAAWWNHTGKRVVADLAALLDTNIPYRPTTDADEQRRQIDRIEDWWRTRRD
jgi:hypothetical protein